MPANVNILLDRPTVVPVPISSLNLSDPATRLRLTCCWATCPSGAGSA